MIWTLRKKIFIGYSIVLALLVVVFIWAFVYLLMLGQASNAILKNNYKSILAADNMIGAIERQDSAILLVILDYSKDGVRQFHDNERIFLQWFTKAKDNITEEGETEAVNAIDTGYSSYLVDFSNLIQLHNIDPKKTALFYHETVLPTFQLVRDKCLRLREINQAAMSRTSERARHISENAVGSMTVIGIVAVIIGISFSLFLSNRLVKPITQITEAMKKVSENNYDSKVLVASKDELGGLADQFNVMIERLKAYHDLNIGQIISEKQKNEAIIRSIDDGVIVIDTEYKIANINPTAVKFFGIESNAIQGKHFLEVVKNEQLFSYVKQSIESGQPPTIGEELNTLAIKHGDALQYYMFSITPVYQKDSDSDMLGVILLLRDVTRLKELDRLKSEFVMTASHELRTPIASILMSIDLIRESAMQKLNEREQELLSIAGEEARRFKSLIDDLLNLSKIETGKIEMELTNVSVLTLLQKAVEVLKSQADDKSIKLSFEIMGEPFNVKVDPGKIIWVLTNLISNALRYTDSGGYILIFAERVSNQAHISVSDNGEGIPYEYQPRIFDKFVQVKSEKSVDGSGLGLSICREIVRAHGGTIWVESKPGEGSTFTFTLPIAN